MPAVALGLKLRTLNNPGLVGPSVACLNSSERVLSTVHLPLKLELSGLTEGPDVSCPVPGPYLSQTQCGPQVEFGHGPISV